MAVALPMGPWKRLGPALRSGPLPVFGVTVSVLGHAILLGSLALVAGLWTQSNQPKVYVVNLVAGLASPRPSPLPALPPLPTASPPLPESPPDLPPLPTLARPAPQLPPAALPPRELPRPVESFQPRDLPRGQTAERTSPSEARPVARQPAPAGGPTAVSAEVSDFPFAWYLRQVLGKVEQEWAKRPPISDPPQRPVIFVEILRDGSISPPRVEKSSGNAFYDQAAVRAITNASPFPRLPDEWTRPSLRILFGFELRPIRG